ncbi:SWIM zinc finger family protein [Streptomyces physcomitrii]|uniref:SWIM zinc finger family protein n=1 Tax=Streptomyces physcomitrii TaxID=2724184 RepID=UPI003F4D3000
MSPAGGEPGAADEARRALRAARDRAAPASPAAPVRPARRRPVVPAAVPPELHRTFAPDPPAGSSPRALPRELRAAGRQSGAPDRSRRTADPAAPHSWWGRAWLIALEERALDPARLRRGREYAAAGRVDTVSVAPGRLLAYVHGSRPRPYRALIRLRTLDTAEWDDFLDAAAAAPAHLAALLDGELPAALAQEGPLLPGPGELRAECNCPDDGLPCKHAAALCYRAAAILDADPFALLLLRGRGERDLLDELTRRGTALRTEQDPGEEAFPGVPAREVLAGPAPGPLPAPLPPPANPGHPPAYPAVEGGPDPFALDQLAGEAAARAHAWLRTGEDPLAGLGLWQDAVRLAAARPGSGLTGAGRALYVSLAEAAGRTPGDLARAVAAWRQGGPDALAVLEEEPWDPPAGRFDRARPVLRAAGHPVFRPWHNRLSHPSGTLQLRLGREGLWYAYESEAGEEDWWPRGTADPDPVTALAAE